MYVSCHQTIALVKSFKFDYGRHEQNPKRAQSSFIETLNTETLFTILITCPCFLQYFFTCIYLNRIIIKIRLYSWPLFQSQESLLTLYFG